MKITGDWLTRAETQRILRLLSDAGHHALVVGGCVRNAVLGVGIADVDISTDARPDRVMALAAEAGIKAVPTGFDHGTVTLVVGGIPYEVTTFRRDVETDGRRAVVAFADDLADDAVRRDFTMNALYARADGTVVDPLGGLPDALARRIRFVGRPEDRIREDYLRILRFFRFIAWFGDPAEGPDAEGLAACAALSDGIGTLSRERLGAEMKKLLAAPDPAPAVAAMAASGVLLHVLPGADPRTLAPLVHLEHGPSNALRRLAVLGGQNVAAALRLSKTEAKSLDAIGTAAQSGESAAAVGWRLGADLARDAMLVRAALIGTEPPAGWQAEVARGAAAEFPVSAADLMPEFSGAALGARLDALQKQWLDSDLQLTRDQLLAGKPG
jgi:poly(A) polymerase